MAIAVENYRELYFTNGGSNEMNVDGSVTPVEFTLEGLGMPIPRFNLLGITFYIEDNSNFNSSTFGALPALTNGFLFQLDGGADLSLLKDNADIAASFPIHQQLSVLKNNDRQHLLARALFVDPLLHTNPVKAIVQDDLTGLSMLRVAVTLSLIPEGT